MPTKQHHLPILAAAFNCLTRPARISPLEGFEAQIRYIQTTNIFAASAVILARLDKVSPTEKRVAEYNRRNQLIRDLYESGMTQAEIAARFSMTPERVSQIVNKK